MATSTLPTTLEFLFVSTDPTSLQAVKSGATECGASLDCTSTLESARDYVAHHRVDGVILDLEASSTLDMISSIRQIAPNRRAFIFACVDNHSDSVAALRIGANVLLHRPLTTQNIVTNIRTFQVIMACERRRSLRHEVRVPVSLIVDDIKHSATTINLSEGGMAVRLSKVLQCSTFVDFLFQLPAGAYVNGRGRIAWADDSGLAGIQFQELRDKSRENLLSWLVTRTPKQ